MKLQLVFENSGDYLEFDVVQNHELLSFFVQQSNAKEYNRFRNNDGLKENVTTALTEIDSAVRTTNEVLRLLTGKPFDNYDDLTEYLNQRVLNKQHSDWCNSQSVLCNIDTLRFNEDSTIADIGNRLHDLYPDEIRDVLVAPLMKN
jgi:hypothetical protein